MTAKTLMCQLQRLLKEYPHLADKPVVMQDSTYGAVEVLEADRALTERESPTRMKVPEEELIMLT